MNQGEQAIQSMLVMLWNALGVLRGWGLSLRLAMARAGLSATTQTLVLGAADVLILALCARVFHGWFRTLIVLVTILILIYLLQPWARLHGLP